MDAANFGCRGGYDLQWYTELVWSLRHSVALQWRQYGVDSHGYTRNVMPAYSMLWPVDVSGRSPTSLHVCMDTELPLPIEGQGS